MAATAAAPSTGPRYAPEDPTLPKPWRGLIDGSTGYLYFWNPETNVTQYERPVSKQLPGPPALPPPPPKPSSASVNSSVQSYHSSGSNGPGQQRDSRNEDRRYGSSRGSHHQGARGTSSNSQNNVNGSVGDGHGSPHLYNQGHATQSSRPSAKGTGSSHYGGSLSVEAYRRQHEITINGDNIPAPYMTFDSTGFPTELLREVQNAGFSHPTPIQAQAWPIALQSRDVVAIAKTGSGKTLGYLFPGFLHLARTRNNSKMGPTVLVLAPTRELATQILDEAVKFGRSSRISSTCLYGGAPKGPQLRDLDRGVDIVVATPGRLNDILEMRRVSLRQVSYLVLDEADRMLDMGFEPQIRKIVKEIPSRRQTLMFTATWPKEVRKIASEFMIKPAQVNIGSIDELVANKAITQYVEVVTSIEKQRRLEQILRSQEPGSKIIIFCSTKRMCDQLARSLTRQFGAAAIHGDKSQSERDYVLGQFRTGRSPILVATDVAARGLDIKDIRVVINYDFPTGVEDYVHRIGRTGRAGATGISYTFFSDQDAKHATDLIKVLEGANQRVPPEIRNMASRGGGHGKFRRWGSGSTFGGRDGVNGRSDNVYSERGGHSGIASDNGYGGRGSGSDNGYGGRAGGGDSGYGGRAGGSDSRYGGRTSGGGGSDSGYGGRGGGNDSRHGSRGGDGSDGGRDETDRHRHIHSYHNSHMESSRGYHDSKSTRTAGDRKSGERGYGRSRTRSNSPAMKVSYGGTRVSRSRSRSRSRNLGRSPSRRSQSRSRTRSPLKFGGNGQAHGWSSSSRRDSPPVEPPADRSPPSHALHHSSPPPLHQQEEGPPHSGHRPSSSPSARDDQARSPFRPADNGSTGVVSPAKEHDGFPVAEGGDSQGNFTEGPLASSLSNPLEEEEGMIPVDNIDGSAPSDAGCAA